VLIADEQLRLFWKILQRCGIGRKPGYDDESSKCEL